MSEHHRHSRRHRASRPADEGEARAKRRSRTESDLPSGERSERRRTGRGGRGSSAGEHTPRSKRFSQYCLWLGALALLLTLAAELTAHVQQAPTLPALNILSAAAALAALAAGLYAIAALARHSSRRVRARIGIGLAVAVCAGLATVSNFFDKHRQLAPPGEGAAPAPAAAPSKPQNDELFKPGWFGETLASGLLVTITAFEEDAAESRRFNRELSTPVHYATLTIVNAGDLEPVSVRSIRTSLFMKDGSTAETLPLDDLLAHGAAQSEALRQRLTANQTITMGGMAADVPICTATNVQWSQVVAVSVRIGPRAIRVPGRVMTAKEKSGLLRSGTPAATNTNRSAGSAEEWYKQL